MINIFEKIILQNIVGIKVYKHILRHLEKLLITNLEFDKTNNSKLTNTIINNTFKCFFIIYNMKTLGILLNENNNEYKIDKDIVSMLSMYDVNIVGIIVNNNYSNVIDIINKCDGFIIINNSKEDTLYIKIINYLYNNDKVSLFINDGIFSLVKIKDYEIDILDNDIHNNNHDIKLRKDTFLYKIIGNNIINVKSNHINYIKYTNFTVSSISTDFIIESIEDNTKKFFLGLQFPIDDTSNINNKLIIDEFIKCL